MATNDKNITLLRRTILYLLLLLPNIYALLQVSDLTVSPIKSIIYLIVVLVCLLLPALVLKARAYFIVEGVLSLFCAPIEIASIFLNKETLTQSFLALVYFTDSQEAGELLASLWFLVIPIIVVWVMYFFLASREPREWLLPKLMQRVLLISVPTLLLCGMIVFGILSHRLKKEQTLGQIAEDATDKVTLKFYKIFPYNFYLNSLALFHDERAITRQQEALEHFTFGIDKQQDTVPGVIVLVIGETARSANFSLNGYTRETNPRLMMRHNIISYPHAYSQANLTGFAVPHILSRITIDQRDRLYDEKDVIDAFKEAGFSNAWITNQTAGTYTARHLRTTDYHFTSTKGLSSVDNYDIALLSPLNDALTTLPNQHKVICLHTMGNHWRYDSRYPDEFGIFTPATDNNFNITNITPDAKEQLLNAYDNCIIYTDYFLDSLISCLERLHLPSMMLYLSDHGENLYDDRQQAVLHGSYAGTRYEYNIPFIIWYSDEYESLYPAKTAAMKMHQQTQFNSSTVFHTLLDAADIQQSIDVTKSLCSTSFHPLDTMPALTGNETLIMITRDTILH